MKVLVTGASGLVGSSLIKILLKRGHNIITLGRTNISGCDNILHDFNNLIDLEKLPSSMDVVYHIAQSEFYREFPNSSEDIFNVNTLSTLKLAEWARKTGVKKFIYTSSGGVYGNNNKVFEENDNIKFNNLGFYLGSKLCSEIILDSYKNFFEVFVLRLFFVYGLKQKKNMLIPRLIRNIMAGNEITISGKKGVLINPIYVEDTAEALSACLNLSKGGEFNISGNENINLHQISEIIGQKLGISPKYIFLEDSSEDLKIIGDNSKMKKFLHNPKVPFDNGIEFLINEI